MNYRSSIACAAIAALLTACAGYRGGDVVPSIAPSLQGAATADGIGSGKARLAVALLIPRKRHHAHYISPSTQSIRIKERTTTLGTFNTTPSSKGCVQQGGATVCTFSMGAVPGRHVPITVDTFDGTGGGGTLLSYATISKTIRASKANTLSITLDGVPATLALQLSNDNPTQGTAADLTLTVTAQDAGGNTIVGPGNYARTISLADSNPGVATLGSSAVVSPSGNVVGIHYTGATGSATFTASATGVSNVTATLQSVKPHSQYVGGVWAALPSFGSIPYYAASASPSFGLDGGGLTNATAVAVDDTGGVIAGDASGHIEHWAIDATGSATPAQSLTGAGNVTALAWDAANGRIIYASSGSASFCVVNANASGAVSGNQTCYSSPHYLLSSTVSGLAVDPNNGTLWVANATPIASGGGSGDCPIGTGGQSCVNLLIFTLSGGTYNFNGFVNLYDCTGPYWNNVGQIAFDPSHTNGDGSVGVLWVADATPGNDVVYGISSSSTGCSIPNSYSFNGDGANLAQPYSLAWDGSSGMWVGDQSTTFLQHWTNVYTSPSVPTGSSYYLGAADGNTSPTNIAVYSVYTPASRKRAGP